MHKNEYVDYRIKSTTIVHGVATSVFYKFCQVQYLEMSFESYERRHYKKFVILIRLFCYNCFR